jgi:hypothetical protein
MRNTTILDEVSSTLSANTITVDVTDDGRIEITFNSSDGSLSWGESLTQEDSLYLAKRLGGLLPTPPALPSALRPPPLSPPLDLDSAREERRSRRISKTERHNYGPDAAYGSEVDGEGHDLRDPAA